MGPTPKAHITVPTLILFLSNITINIVVTIKIIILALPGVVLSKNDKPCVNTVNGSEPMLVFKKIATPN